MCDVYIKGGYVRDTILGRTYRDIDYAVVGDVEDVRRAFGKPTFIKGKNFKYPLKAIVSDGKDDVSVYDSLDGYEELCDFTVNSLLMSLDGRVIGSLRAFCDLRDGIIRETTAESLIYDPVRALRGIRLSKELGFEIEPVTMSHILLALPKLYDKKLRRKLYNELRKINDEKAFSLLVDNGLDERPVNYVLKGRR